MRDKQNVSIFRHPNCYESFFRYLNGLAFYHAEYFAFRLRTEREPEEFGVEDEDGDSNDPGNEDGEA